MAGGDMGSPVGGGMSGQLKSRKVPNNFKIQITSMVDMFVILLVFLLKSFSTSPVQVTPTKDLTLPTSTSATEPVDVVKMVVSKIGVFIEEKKILDFDKGQFSAAEVDPNDDRFLPNLFKALDQQAEQMRSIAQVNKAVEFDGRILLQADRDVPYSILQKVMYTSMMAGYSDVKIAVAE